jgi:N-methylhydantoinase A
MALHVAVDIGGTFTDLIGYDDGGGHIFSAKSSSTPSDLTVGIMRCLEKSGMDIAFLTNFVHGSTVAINTVIERKGAATALLVTKGTRDVIEIGRGNRPDAYDIFFNRPVPLVPRHRIFEIDERCLASGDIAVPLDSQQAEGLVKKIMESDVEAVAVCLLHSWANSEHEAELGKILTTLAPDKYVSLSHEILREYGEYERTSTTVLNAYIGPRVSTYVQNLATMLRQKGFFGSLLIMQSNGGVMSPEMACTTPVAMLESGPVGGFIAAAHVGQALGIPQQANGYYIGGYARGYPMMLPVIDTIEIGAGGGSIAWVDEVGALRIGPHSAGAEPGPMCYGRGGTDPTITDANLLLGRLIPSEFLGGEMPLEVKAARSGIETNICERTGLSPLQAAHAITKVAVMKMSLAVRGVSIERGYDPRDFAMVAFGGAGGLHAAEVARELHIPTVIVPNYPGQFSALGMLVADIQHDYVQTYYRPLQQTDFGVVSRICQELTDAGRLRLESEQISAAEMTFEPFLDIRYKGQEFSISVPIPIEILERGDQNAVRQAFDTLHEHRYGYHTPEQPAEIVNARIRAVGKRGRFSHPVHGFGRTKALEALKEKRMVYLDDPQQAVECRVYQREGLEPGQEIGGPAIISEYASTTVLFPGDRLTVADTGELLISIGGEAN